MAAELEKPLLRPWSLGFSWLPAPVGEWRCRAGGRPAAPNACPSNWLPPASGASHRELEKARRGARPPRRHRWRLRMVGLAIGYALPVYASAWLEFVASHLPEVLVATLASTVLAVAAQPSHRGPLLTGMPTSTRLDQ